MKTPILLRNVDQKLLETEFLIAICHQYGDKWQLKTLFLSLFDPCPSVVGNVFDCCLPGVLILIETNKGCSVSLLFECNETSFSCEEAK